MPNSCSAYHSNLLKQAIYMGTPNQEIKFPELPNHGDREARLWAVGAFTTVLQGGYVKAKWTESRISSDLYDVIPAPRQQQEQTVAQRIINATPLIVSQEVAAAEHGGSQAPRQEDVAKWSGSRLTDARVIEAPARQAAQSQQTAAQIIQGSQPYIPTQRASEPYWPGSRAAQAAAAAYVPERLSAADEQASRAETAKLLEEVERLREEAGMPAGHTVEATTPAPVMVAEPEAIVTTPLQQAEQLLPADNGAYPNYKGTPVDALLEQIGYLHDNPQDQENN
jgi:hypothetical protein